ncbi:response regulator transcription factor [Roseateles sp. DAIF2]|uniref:response regulator transcription factor n=1 Tax=Roseateles sp. DAIF2 TaxID=2714952 RepID=UPI0018A2F939|nr:response regulator transcription factor [Roseateles sp. DAIF2]QPF75625.1 response regulator transcription factor [Roseateles sp. DAIF2]
MEVAVRASENRPFAPITSIVGGAADLTIDTERSVRRVLLVDDHELVRAGIRTLYQTLDDLQIEWLEAASLQEGLQVYREQGAIDAVLLDLNLGDCKGLQGLRQFLEAFPQAHVAVFSGTQDEFVVRQARALGAAGYVPKGALMTEMRNTLLALLGHSGRRGGAAQTGALFPRFPSSAMYDRVAELGPRHLEILELVLSGCSNQEISNSTLLSLGTVKNYVSSLLLALDVKSRSHMISLFR